MLPDCDSACPIKNPVGRKKSAASEFELYDSRTESSGERNENPSADHCVAGAASSAAERLTETARAPESYSAVHQMLSYITLNTDGGSADYDVWT
jgi:hypothetical protein